MLSHFLTNEQKMCIYYLTSFFIFAHFSLFNIPLFDFLKLMLLTFYISFVPSFLESKIVHEKRLYMKKLIIGGSKNFSCLDFTVDNNTREKDLQYE